MLPRLLDSGYGEVCRLHPGKLSVKLNLNPLSTATMSLPEGEPTVGIRQWMELYGPYGSLGYFRVSMVKKDCGDGQNLNLEHGVSTLGDSLTAANTTLTGTAYSIMGTLMGYQTKWQRGTVPNTGNYKVPVNRSNVLSAVLDLLKQMNGYGLTYDFSITPWTLGIALLDTDPSGECRMRRNAKSVRISMDDNDLCTRVYATGLTGGYMDSDTVGTWGVIAKNLGTDENAPAAEVQAYATQYLAEYKNPRVNIEISALELAAKTGETLDRFTTGKLCRIALPDWGYSTDQRIVTVNYPDILVDPDNAQLSLSTIPRDLSHTLAALNSDLYGTSAAQGGGGGGGSGKGKLVEYHTAIKRNVDNIQLIAWDVGDLNADMITAMASITLNADNIVLKASRTDVDALTNRVSAAEIDIDGANAAITLKASRTEVDALTNRVSAAEIDIDGANALIALKASQTTVNALTNRVSAAEIDIDGANALIALKASQTTVDSLGERVSSAEIDIDGANAAITLKVSKNGVISSINQTPETISINASKINLTGYVTISAMQAAFASFKVSAVDTLSANYINSTDGLFSKLQINDFRYGLDAIGKSSKTFMTNAALSVSYTTINGVNVVRDVSIIKTTSTMKYLSY